LNEGRKKGKWGSIQRKRVKRSYEGEKALLTGTNELERIETKRR